MQFYYRIRTQKGDVRTGTLEAAHRDGAVAILQRNNFIIVSLEEKSPMPLLAFLKDFFGVSPKEIVIFSRQMSTLLEAKVSILESLKTMMDQTSDIVFKDVLLDIIKNVDAGAPLSKAFLAHENVFSTFYVSMLKSGEVSGRLEEIFGYLADYLERRYYIRQKVKGAITYPAFIIVAFIAVFFIMMIWVVPNLTNTLKETGTELPFLTELVIGFSDSVVVYWWIYIGVLLGGIGGIIYFIHTPQGKSFWHRLQLHLPILGMMYKKFYLAQVADNLSILVHSGIPIVQAIEITAEVVYNEVYKEILVETQEEVRKGNTISSVLRKKTEVPLMVTQMIYVGEEAGKLDKTLRVTADFYNREVTALTDNLVALIEPLLIVFLGIGVGILLVAILMPMYDVARSF